MRYDLGFNETVLLISNGPYYLANIFLTERSLLISTYLVTIVSGACSIPDRTFLTDILIVQ